jgi:hypothetical protein
MDREEDHNFKSSPRADSFVDAVIIDAIDLETQTTSEDHAIIKCVCGFGKGADDDDAIICDQCGTWQHTLCYFYQKSLPADDAQYLCVECKPRPDVDANAAASRMRQKLQALSAISDRISELSCEILVREEELQGLEYELASLSVDLSIKAPLLQAHATPAARSMLDELHAEYLHLQHRIARTAQERDAIRLRVEELEDDGNRVKRNEVTRAEELKLRWRDRGSVPKLWTMACSLGDRAAVPYALPPVLMMGGNGKGKVGKRKRKRKGLR